MSNIDKQALREAAVRAGGVKWQYMRATQHSKAYITDDKGSPIVNCTDGDVPAKCAGFLESANPAAVLALLDELEAAAKRIAELEATAFSKAAIDVLAERQRQQSAEGWTTEHDDDHSCGEMALAASSYAQYAHRKPIAPAIPFNWPWEPEWFKQQGPRRDLVKAGALILAEIERIDRAAAGKGE
ncbi:ead/Ea22-like family protein [Enterobacter hormaechei]|uniref:ead/Ea22-like family protein n=1 Tax=Enterobacter hormaechei TaxID=158836 RepID=UPI0011F33FDE|nr:ead/Ea22-like family protein [Enterobacter hormaechei]KAA0592100.1 ead/Ea22-like family protein [Enterobacter hormaechei]